MGNLDKSALTARGGFLAETYRTSGITGCLRKMAASIRMALPVMLLGRRTNASVAAYFDLITDDGRLFYGDSFHFGYFPSGEKTLQEGLNAHTDLVGEMACLNGMGHVLDLGCGIGEPAIRLAGRHPIRITGVNISAEQIRQGTALVASGGLAERIRLVEGNALQLAFDSNSFDGLICLEVAGDICVNESQKRRLVHEMFRVLKPGGRIGFSDLVFTKAPKPAEEKTLRMILYHEGRELVTDWPTLFVEAGFVIRQQINILLYTMPTWDYSLAVYTAKQAEVERRFGKTIASNILKHLALIPGILKEYGAFPVLSLEKPA